MHATESHRKHSWFQLWRTPHWHSVSAFRWIQSCAQLFLDNRRFWFHLVPPNDTDSTERVRDLFACVATMMSRQLRELIIDSLAEFLDCFLIHQVCTSHSAMSLFVINVISYHLIQFRNTFVTIIQIIAARHCVAVLKLLPTCS